MKRCINYLFIIVVIYSLFNLKCYASTNTFVRTDSDLKVPSDVVVDSNNHRDIMLTPSVSASEKVYDYAELLSPEQEKKVYDKIVEYNKNSGYDAVIVTTNNLNGKNLSQYTYNFYDYNDFNDEGVIFVIYIENGKPTIFMGNCGPKDSKIFSIYDNKVVNSTLKYLYENSITKGNYYEACYNFVKIVNGFYVQKETNNLRIDGEGKVIKTVPIFEVLVIALAVTFIIVMFMVTKAKSRISYKNQIERNINKSTMVVECEYDKLV